MSEEEQKIPTELDWDVLDSVGAVWARQEIAEIAAGCIELALKEKSESGINEGVLSAQSVATLQVLVQRYQKFMVEHSAKAGEMEPEEWTRQLILEGNRFWGRIAGIAVWGEYYFAKMVGLSIESIDEERGEDGGD